MLVEFFFGLLRSVAILRLKQAEELLEITGHLIKIVLVKFAPPCSDPTPDLKPLVSELTWGHRAGAVMELPLTREYILGHGVIEPPVPSIVDAALIFDGKRTRPPR
jgi:hypothetical protein